MQSQSSFLMFLSTIMCILLQRFTVASTTFWDLFSRDLQRLITIKRNERVKGKILEGGALQNCLFDKDLFRMAHKVIKF